MTAYTRAIGPKPYAALEIAVAAHAVSPWPSRSLRAIPSSSITWPTVTAVWRNVSLTTAVGGRREHRDRRLGAVVRAVLHERVVGGAEPIHDVVEHLADVLVESIVTSWHSDCRRPGLATALRQHAPGAGAPRREITGRL